MIVITDKISDSVAARLGGARQRASARVKPYTGATGRAAAKLAAAQTADRARAQFLQARIQARSLMKDKVVPTMQHRVIPAASSAIDNAMIASAPVRKEAARRAVLAAAALRGDDVSAVRKHRHWPTAVGFLVLGGAAGAAATWLSQAGKPVQLTPYPLPSDDDRRIGDTVDLDAEERARRQP